MKEIRPIILFVDDEELARRTFERMVSKEFRVLLAEDVGQAQQVLKEHHDEIGVLLTDQRMPGKLGVDLLEHCREEYPDIVRMLTTAYSELDDAIAAVNRGEIVRYIEKPWGNIDGILIDLNLAATLYEIKKENQQLIDEKLSVGFKNSQLEKIRALITVAACQDTTNNFIAVESLLRQIADVPACYSLPDIEDLRNYQMFGQPLDNTICAIEIARAMKKNTTGDASSVAELSGESSTLNAISEEDLSEIIGCGLVAMKQDATVESSEAGEGMGLTLSAKKGGSAIIPNWLGSYEVSKETSSGIASILTLYLQVYEKSGQVNLIFNEDGLINAIQINFIDAEQEKHHAEGQIASYDWIDDLMILFS